MDHTPFIVGAYGAAIAVLLWCAVAPVLRGRKFRARMIRVLNQSRAKDEDSS